MPTSGYATVLSTPQLLSRDMKEKLRNKSSKQDWYFFPEHREKGEDGKWRLTVDKSGKTTHFDMERQAFNFPPPRNVAPRFINNEYFSTYVRPQDRWSIENAE